MEKDALDYLGGRKFIMAIYCLALVFALVCLKLAEVDKFVSLVEYVLTTYVIGNVVSKVVDLKIESKKE
jgi:hypothetical protein